MENDDNDQEMVDADDEVRVDVQRIRNQMRADMARMNDALVNNPDDINANRNDNAAELPRPGEGRGRIRRFHREMIRREGLWERQRQRRARIEMFRMMEGRPQRRRFQDNEEEDHHVNDNDIVPNRAPVAVPNLLEGEAPGLNVRGREQVPGPNERRGVPNAHPPVPEGNIRVFERRIAAARPANGAEGQPGNPNPGNGDNRNNNGGGGVAVRFNGDGNQDDNDDDFDDFLMMDFAQGRFEHHISRLRAARENISSGLFDMVKEGRTCISVLSGWGRSEQDSCNSIVQHCIAHPDDALYVSRLGRMPIHEACLRGACRHVIKALLEATNNRGAKERDQLGNTPLHLLFVDYSSSNLNNSNLVWSPEDLAQVVSDLLAVNPLTIASSTNADGDTPLHSACMAPETMVDPSTIVQLLQANPRAATRNNRKNQTPLRLHCQRRNASPRVAELLLEENTNALIVLDNERGWAPIHAAAANANFKLLRYLVEAFPDSVKVRTSQRQTALHLLCQHHTHLSSVRSPASLHNESHASFGARENRSNSNDVPNVEAAVEFLLNADPDAIMHQDSTHGYTPLHLVCKTEGSRQVPLSVVNLLLRCNPKAAGVPDSQQYLPLHHACEMGANPEVIQALVEAYPAATSTLTRKKDSALSLACTANKSAATVQLLIQANSKVLTQKNDYGFSPLHCVCRAHQPRMGIVQALVDACPESVTLQTNSGETPFHLASTNTGAFVGVLQLLAQTQSKMRGTKGDDVAKSLSLSKEEQLLMGPTRSITSYSNEAEVASPFNHEFDRTDDNDSHPRNPRLARRVVTTNKMGNTPLHDACFRNTPYEHLEVIAKTNPEYILVRNNAGYTPLQILCKNGRIDERIISTFAQMGGPDIFTVKDATGNTPLHSAMRKDVDVASLRCLIRASPDALRCRTTYGDLPLHLACLRKCSSEVVQEVAIAASSGDVSLAVVPNFAGQTPIGIAMGEFRNLYQDGTCTTLPAYRPAQRQNFQVLSTLVKIVHYGPIRCQQQGTKDLSLLHACLVLHRQNIRLDPAFIREVIHMYPEEVKLMDENGNYPLHIEASIPIEKMSLLDGVGSGPSHLRMGILRILLEAYPSACSFRNRENHFPLGLMIQAGRVWGHTIAVALKAFPPALHWYKGLDDRFSSILLEKASKECGADTLFALLVSRPGLFDTGSHRRGLLQE